MNRWTISLGTALVLLVGLALAAPIGPVPGFFIGGSPVKAPIPWPDTGQVDEVRLQVPGLLPRVVIIWIVEFEGELHVVGSKDSGWVQMLGPGGPVKLRLEGSTYDLVAERVTDGWEPILAAYIDKYKVNYPEIVSGFPSLEEAEGAFGLFRLNRT
ncbi:MAG: hypothetical protein AAF648_09690 [Pseudomonadota bacterium]